MKKIYKYLIFSCFGMYWLATFFIVLPNNPIKASYKRQVMDFGLLFDQRWSFFAPPPKTNTRLYYTFSDEKDSISKTFEVMKPLLDDKRKKAPFNSRVEIVDYILNGSIIHIYDLVIDQREKLQLQYKDSTKMVIELMARDSVIKRMKDIHAFKTLIEYSKIVSRKNLAKEEVNKLGYLKIALTEINIPKFIDRNKESPNREGLVIETTPINLSDYE